MRISIRSSNGTKFNVAVNFSRAFQSPITYEVYATNRAEAIKRALEFARNDLSTGQIDEEDEGEYSIAVYLGIDGSPETYYVVYAGSRAEAAWKAMEQAKRDLVAEIQ